MLDKLVIMAYCSLMSMRQKFDDFMHEEKGGSEIIAMVLIIAIVLVLAGIFWDKISAFFESLWNSVVAKNPVDDIHK